MTQIRLILEVEFWDDLNQSRRALTELFVIMSLKKHIVDMVYLKLSIEKNIERVEKQESGGDNTAKLWWLPEEATGRRWR